MITIKPTNKAELLAAFPEAPPQITGEPTIGELVRILQHLMFCAQSQHSDISLLNLLYVCIPETLNHHYNDANEAHPTDPTDPGATAIFSLGDDADAHCSIRARCEYMRTKTSKM